MAGKREVYLTYFARASVRLKRGVWCKLIRFLASFTLEKVKNACFFMREFSIFFDLLWSEEDEPGDGGGEH